MKVSIVALMLLLGKDSQSVTSANRSPELSPTSSTHHHGIPFPSMLTPTEVIAMPPPPPTALIMRPPLTQVSGKGKKGQDKKKDNEEKKRPHIKKTAKKKEEILSCGDENVYISRSSLQWTNPRYPFGETQRMSCRLRIKRDPRIWQEILQIKVIVADLVMSQPQNGFCLKDNITLIGARLQGQAVGRRGLQLCGEEPDDFVVIDGKKYPQHKHLYMHFPEEKEAILSFNVSLSASKTGRRWNILLKPIEAGSPERAPFGCLEYYTRSADKTQEYFRVVRSLNYPHSLHHGMIDGMKVGICFQVSGCDSVTGLRLTPSAGDFKCDPFRLQDHHKSGIDEDCKHSYFLLPYSHGLPTRICAAQTEKGKNNTLAPIVLKHGPLFRLEYHSSGKKGGYRFLWDFERFACPDSKCVKT